MPRICSHDDALPASAVLVHSAPSEALTLVMSEQHPISVAQAPADAPLLPPSPLVTTPLLLPPPSGEHADSHIADSQSKTGPSQTWQLIVMHVVSDGTHLVSRQSTHSVSYP
jgi:hypothetical protein